MLDLLLKLLDRLIDLGKRREEVRRDTFSDFIAPAMIDLETIHKNYMETFRRYRTLIEDTAQPMTPHHPVLTAIKADNLFSEDLRAKVKIAWRNFNQPAVAEFLAAAHSYVFEAVSIQDKKFEEEYKASAAQIYRNFYQSQLKHIVGQPKVSDAEKRFEALGVLDETVALLQERYASVLSKFAELRKSLLARS